MLKLLSAMVEEFKTNSCIHGYHIYQDQWLPIKGNGWNAKENWEIQETAMLQLYAKDMKQWAATCHYNIVFDN